MEIKPGKFVEVSYKLYGSQKGAKEEMLEETRPDQPFKFIFGTGFMLESFEKKIENLSQGDSFDFVVPCAEAFGDEEADAIFDLSKDIFKNAEGEFDSESVVEGAILPMQNAERQIINGKVMKINEDTVKMNFNHPFAGMDLHFVGKVDLVRETTEEDIHEFQGGCEGGCEGCGSDCGCGDDCNCDGNDGEKGCGCGCH